MSDITHTDLPGYEKEWRAAPERESAVRLALIDYATLAFVLLSVATGPGLVWVMLWLASR
jgi:hypothetical protein